MSMFAQITLTSEWWNYFWEKHNFNNTNTVNMGTLFLLQGPRIWMDNWINTHLPVCWCRPVQTSHYHHTSQLACTAYIYATDISCHKSKTVDHTDVFSVYKFRSQFFSRWQNSNYLRKSSIQNNFVWQVCSTLVNMLEKETNNLNNCNVRFLMSWF